MDSKRSEDILFYARAIDNNKLPALNEILVAQAAPTKKTREKVNMLLDYLSTYPDANIRFKASDMILQIDSDAAYPIVPKALQNHYHHEYQRMIQVI